jgi:hypothetical protein
MRRRAGERARGREGEGERERGRQRRETIGVMSGKSSSEALCGASRGGVVAAQSTENREVVRSASVDGWVQGCAGTFVAGRATAPTRSQCLPACTGTPGSRMPVHAGALDGADASVCVRHKARAGTDQEQSPSRGHYLLCTLPPVAIAFCAASNLAGVCSNFRMALLHPLLAFYLSARTFSKSQCAIWRAPCADSR